MATDPTKLSANEVEQLHRHADKDASQQAFHHTLGSAHNQAAPGDHSHDGGSSTTIGEGGDMLKSVYDPAGANGQLALLNSPNFTGTPTIVTDPIKTSATVQHGSYSMAACLTGAFINKTVFFSPTYASAPNVTANPGSGRLQCAIISVTYSQVVIQAQNFSGGTSPINTVQWIAVGD